MAKKNNSDLSNSLKTAKNNVGWANDFVPVPPKVANVVDEKKLVETNKIEKSKEEPIKEIVTEIPTREGVKPAKEGVKTKVTLDKGEGKEKKIKSELLDNYDEKLDTKTEGVYMTKNQKTIVVAMSKVLGMNYSELHRIAMRNYIKTLDEESIKKIKKVYDVMIDIM